MREIEHSRLTEGHAILNGFLAGCFIAASIFNAYGLLIQGILFFIGFFVIIDNLMPSGEMLFAASMILFAVIGFVIEFVINFWSASTGTVFIISMFMIILVSYFFRFRKLKSHHRG